jgi:hypothetical protein
MQLQSYNCVLNRNKVHSISKLAWEDILKISNRSITEFNAEVVRTENGNMSGFLGKSITFAF